MMEPFAKIVNDFWPLFIFAKTLYVDVWQGSKYASVKTKIIITLGGICSAEHFPLSVTSGSSSSNALHDATIASSKT